MTHTIPCYRCGLRPQNAPMALCLACWLEHACVGAHVLYQRREHVVTSVVTGRLGGPHVRLRCLDCPPGCDARTLTSVRLLQEVPMAN